MLPAAASGRVAIVSVALLAALAGCGGGSAESVAPGTPPTPGGTLAIAVPAAPHTLDPLLARTPADLLVARQIYEPLIERLSGPYGDVRRRAGLVISADPAEHNTIWRLHLRSNVRFQDGARFNASAVLANVERWRGTSEGSALLPGLVAVDAPRPDLVRFIFSEPDPDLKRQLASPQLGIVSPRALRSTGASARLARGVAAGTGAFELRERDPQHLLLARNVQWWGTRHELGPAVDQIDLRIVTSPAERLMLLRRGEVQVAYDLESAQVARLRRDPLLTALPGKGSTALGLERSVRGIASAGATPVLSQAWLTRIATGAG